MLLIFLSEIVLVGNQNLLVVNSKIIFFKQKSYSVSPRAARFRLVSDCKAEALLGEIAHLHLCFVSDESFPVTSARYFFILY